MGSNVEINDTLQLTTAQGFPIDIFDYDKHRLTPVTLADVTGKVFSFKNKSGARLFHLDPVRVFLVHAIDGKWLFWGRVLMQSQTIEKAFDDDGNWDGKSWMTSGSYTVMDVYDPAYQKAFTCNEAPEGRSFFNP
jgi:hypothetical protein